MPETMLSAMEAAKVLGIRRERVVQLAALLDIGERDTRGHWRFHPERIAALAATELVRPTQGQEARPPGARAKDVA